MNRYLIEELKALGLWNDGMRTYASPQACWHQIVLRRVGVSALSWRTSGRVVRQQHKTAALQRAQGAEVALVEGQDATRLEPMSEYDDG